MFCTVEVPIGQIADSIFWAQRLEHLGVSVMFPLIFGYTWRYGLDNYIQPIRAWNCQPNGWLMDGLWTFIGINICVGRMSFGQAKALDMVWNRVAGRSVQVLLAWLVDHMFAWALMRIAEFVLRPYDLSTSLALYSTRPSTVWDLGKGLGFSGTGR